MSIGYKEKRERTMKAMGSERSYILVGGFRIRQLSYVVGSGGPPGATV